MEEIMIDSDEISCMFGRGRKTVSADEQLALFMQKFNLDRDTVEMMPAFEKHCKIMFQEEIIK